MFENLEHLVVTSTTGDKPRNYHEIVLVQICSQATSGTRRGSFQAENWIKKGWCHVHFCFILQLRTNNGEIRQCSSVYHLTMKMIKRLSINVPTQKKTSEHLLVNNLLPPVSTELKFSLRFWTYVRESMTYISLCEIED